jgi:hypothetical protein
VTRLRITGRGKPARRIVAAVRKGSLDSPLIKESLGILQDRAKRILTERLEEEG